MKHIESLILICMLYLLAGFQVVSGQQGAEVYDRAVQIMPLLQADRTNTGQPIVYPDTDRPEVSIIRVVIPPGVETGWHSHPVNGFAVILQGELNIKQRGGESMTYRAGDAFAEMVDQIHRGKNTGDEPVELIMFIIGEKGQPFSMPVGD